MQAAPAGSGKCSSRHSCRSPGLRLGRYVPGQQHVGAYRRNSSRLQPAQYKAVDLQDDVLQKQVQQQQPISPVQSPVLDQQNVVVPPPSNMQAQVMLVPKKGASTALLRQKPAADDPFGGFLLKCKLAWNLFFPPQQHEEGAAAAATPRLSPKDLGKQRLQMILVADRCGLSPNSLVEMKKNTLAALADCMELEDLQDAHLRFTMTREGGTTYSMAVPILRPGPYAADGSVVGQDAKRAAATTAAAAAVPAGTAMSTATAAADGGAAGWEPDSENEYAAEFYDGVDDGGDDLPVIDAVFTSVVQTAAMSDETAADMSRLQTAVIGDSNASNATESELAAAAAGSVNAEASSGDESDAEGFKEQFKELLVEELMHDVAEQAQNPKTADPEDSTAAAGAAVTAQAAEGAGDATEMSGDKSCTSDPVVGLSELGLREVATEKVQRLVEGDQMGRQESCYDTSGGPE